MKTVHELEIGFSDAENYRRRENRELFNRVFIRDAHLDRLCNPACSFLVGEKGTGKTAYAVYLSNNDFRDTLSQLRYIRETDYQKFIALKREKQLNLSDYASIWTVILYLLISAQVIKNEGSAFLHAFTRMSAIKRAIDEYYNSAFSPEIVSALQFVQEAKQGAALLAKHVKVSGEESETLRFSESRFQVNLLYIQRQFALALSQARLKRNTILFIDGIDIRPASIPFSEYLECIRGLANAVWQINNDFFPSIKGGAGRMRVVLLVRPDIFKLLGLQNQNTKIRDNAVFLDWRTEYVNHRTSSLFRVMDHLLASQNEEQLTLGQAWDYYFPWDAPNLLDKYQTRTSFVSFLRWSYYRPRDIITMLVILREQAALVGAEGKVFSYKDFNSPDFRRAYSDYLLGEVNDHLVFYYGASEYELFLKFFTFLNGQQSFTYSEYEQAFKRFRTATGSMQCDIPRFMSSPLDFLQFLYDLNIICYVETPVQDKPYVRWCFRERSYANIAPKVKEGLKYEIFYGLAKALNVGQKLIH